MKNFEERKAEIFRRCEERRYAAKVRNRVLLCCVPLALCLVTLIALYPTTQTAPPAGSSATSATPNRPMRQCVEIRTESYYQQYTDLQTFTAVSDTLNAIIGNAAGAPPSSDTSSTDLHSGSEDIGPEYTITITDENGVSIYMLTDNILLGGEGTEGLCYELSENEATTLRILIGSEQRHRSVGRYLKSTNGEHLLVINNSVTILNDVSDLFTPFDQIQTGDKLLVFHDAVEETYPARTDAYYAIRLEMGTIDDIPDKVIANLSMLGWLNNLSYTPLKPSEGERRVPFQAQCVYTHSPSDVSHSVTVIRSTDELHDYYEAHKEAFDLERREDSTSDYDLGFLDVCDKYDAAYFEDRILLLVRIGTGSGSHRFRVTDVLVSEDGTLTADIATLVPAVGTCDMAGWHIFIEPPSGINVLDEEHVQINRLTIHLE